MPLTTLAPTLRDSIVAVLVAMLSAGATYLTTGAPRQPTPVVASAPVMAAPTPEITPSASKTEQVDLAASIAALTRELAALRAERQARRVKAKS